MATPRRFDLAQVRLWNHNVGVIAWNASRGLGEFEYEPTFLRLGLDLSPFMMPLRAGTFSFPGLNPDTFHGLPGLLADSLPDRYGHRLIDLWIARQGRAPGDFSPVERLCYMGTRAMGALEFQPALTPAPKRALPLEIDDLTHLATEVLRHQGRWAVHLKGRKADALEAVIRVGTSAGGNRAKAIVAWNPSKGVLRSGQAAIPRGYQPWILKLDGVNGTTLGDPKGLGRVEYAYHKMAVSAGIRMAECHLLEESGRAHFMTRRFDRTETGAKVHMQSLCALGHFDYNASGEYGYEQAFQTCRRLGLDYLTSEELFRRMVFNVLARNQDDHTRNIAFLMDPQGRWSLSPAFDVVWSFNPEGRWTNRHQMSLNSKRDGFTSKDLLTVAIEADVKKPKDIIRRVGNAVAGWEKFASEAGVTRDLIKQIGATHRLGLMNNL